MVVVVMLYLVIEIFDIWYDLFCEVGVVQLIVDNSCVDQFVLGVLVSVDWCSLDLVVLVILVIIEGGEWCIGSGVQVLGDLCVVLIWLVNELCEYGLMLVVGQLVVIGFIIVFMLVWVGQIVLVELGVFGLVVVYLD